MPRPELPTTARLSLFLVGLAASFGAAFGVGRAIDPIDDRPASPPATSQPEPSHEEHP